MSLANYAGLQAEVANWMHRANLTGDIPTFIQLTELRTTRIMNARIQQASGTVTLTAGVQTASLPSDLLRITSAFIPQSSPSMDYVTLDQLNRDYDPAVTGVPVVFATLGSTIYLGPTPDSAYTLKLTYQMQIPALSDTATTNSLLTTWPDIYLYGAIYQAAKFSENQPKMAQFEADYLNAVAELNVLDWQTGGQMRARPDIRVV